MNSGTRALRSTASSCRRIAHLERSQLMTLRWLEMVYLLVPTKETLIASPPPLPSQWDDDFDFSDEPSPSEEPAAPPVAKSTSTMSRSRYSSSAISSSSSSGSANSSAYNMSTSSVNSSSYSMQEHQQPESSGKLHLPSLSNALNELEETEEETV